jgi:hypothetical protein
LAGLLGPALLSAALGVQMMLAALLLVKPPAKQTGENTIFGAYGVRPERDLAVYLGSIAFAFAVGVVLSWGWNRRVRLLDAPVSDRFLRSSLLAQSLVAVGGTAFCLIQFLRARTYLGRGMRVPAWYFATSAAVGAVSIAVGIAGTGNPGNKPADTKRRPPRESWEGEGTEGEEESGIDARAPLKFSALDLIVPIGIVLLIYVPSWRQMSGKAFMEETLFHWDFFAMGPTLAFSHGKALGTEIYSLYGVGWAMVFSALRTWLPISYGRMIQIGSIYACIYLMGVYLFLRLQVRRPSLAAMGTGLVTLHFLLAMGGVVIWRFPSLTVLRSPFDIWCFVALVAHWRSRRRLWAVVAGAFVGLAVLFSTDTGLYLAASVGLYWLGTLWLRSDRKRHAADVIVSGVTGLAVAVAGLAIAGRGTILSAGFWKGWLEPILAFGGGFGMLPLATYPQKLPMTIFVVLFFAYLAIIGYGLIRLLHHRARHFEVLNGFLAIYGLFTLIKFVGYSLDLEVYRLWIPLALILTNLAGRASARAVVSAGQTWGDPRRSRVILKLPYAAAGLVVVLLLVAIPRFWLAEPLLTYPNLVSSTLHGSKPDGLCLMIHPMDICGLPPDLAGTAEQFRAIAGRLRDFSRSGKTFAVIDESGSLFYLASETAPWGRYSRLFPMMVRKEQVVQVKEFLKRHPPDLVVTRMPKQVGYERWAWFGLGPLPDSLFADTRDALLTVVRQRYRLETEMKPFEVWRLAYPAAGESSGNPDSKP